MSDENLGHLTDEQEQQETSNEDGKAAAGEYDPKQGSPDSGEHPVGEAYPEEVTRYDEPESKRSEQS